MIEQTTLDALWDFSDPAGSQDRFDAAAAELATQAVRCLGLQGRFEEGHARLDALAAGLSAGADQPAVQARIALERGRLFNSAGDKQQAVGCFEAAVAAAEPAELLFVKVDALHMLAIADTERASSHTAAALAALADCTDPRTLRWRVSLYNNSGWSHAEAGRTEQALADFRASKEAAQTWGTAQQVQWADEAIAEVSAADQSS